MPPDLAAEIKKVKIANALTNGGDEPDTADESTDETDSTDSTEQTDSGKEPSALPEPAASPSRQEAGFLSFSDYSAASSTPAQPVTYPTITDEPTGGFQPTFNPPVGQAQSAVPVRQAPTYPTIAEDQTGAPSQQLLTDPETGGRYVIDPSVESGIVPHAELATAADKAAQPPGGVVLPKVDVTGVAPAPDRLDQVERGELVGLPWHPAKPQPSAEAPDTLTQVERGQLVPRAIPVQPPDTLSQVEKAQPVTGTAPQPAAQGPVTQQAPTQASARQAAGFLSFDDYSHPAVTQQPTTQQPTAAVKPAAAGQVPAEPGLDIEAQNYTKGRTQPVRNIVMHSTDGWTLKGDTEALSGAGEPGHRVSVHYLIGRDGSVQHFVPEGDSAWQAGVDRYGKNGNDYSIGIEQQHVDGRQDWPEAQVRAAAQTAAGILARHPNMTIDDVIGHSDLAGERKQDPVDYPWDKFRQYVAQAQGGQGAGEPVQQAAAPSAQPVTKLKTGFYQDEKPNEFLTGRVTTFATPNDIATGQDNGVGAPKLGNLDTTQVAGVAIPEAALQQIFGRDWAAAARQARVDVVDPTTGKRLRVPIVDLGPSTDAISDMTPRLSQYFGGDKNLSIKIVPKAGPDVIKNPQLFYDEQAAIKNGFDSSTLDAKRQVIGPQFATRAQTPEEATAAQQKVQAAMQSQQAALAKLPEYGDNDKAVALYKRLDDPVPGVSDPMRLAYQAQVKAEITKYAQDVYGERDPNAAFARATADANFGTVAAEAGHHFMGYLGQADVGLNQLGQMGDTNRLSTFAKLLHPENNPQQNQAFIKSITTDIPDVNLRDRTIGILFSQLEPAKQQMMNSTDIVEAADRVANPAYQKAQQEAIDKKTAWTEGQLKADPQLRGTLAEKAADLGGQFGANALLAFAPPGIRESALAGQVAAMTRADLKQAHPEWSAAELAKHTEDSTALQLVPQEILTAIIGGQFGPMVAKLQGPVSRIAATALTHLGIGATAGTAQQIGANIGAGRPIMTGVPEAAVTGAIMTAPSAAMAGVHAAFHPPGERAAVEQPPVRPEERPPVVEPPVEERPPVEEKPIEEVRPTEEKPPAEERPPTEQEPDPEEALNKQNQQLLDRYKLQGELEKELPIEEKPILADVTEEDARRAREAELGRAPGDIGRPIQDVRGAIVPGAEGDHGRVAPGGGSDVSQELRGVPGDVETKLSPEQRAALQPLADDLVRHPQGTAPAKEAYQKLFEAVYKRLEPIFKAGGIKRVDDPAYDGIAAAEFNHRGNLNLLLNHSKFEEAARLIHDRGNDPVEYINHVLNEELLHHAENLVRVDQWKRETAQGKTRENFVDYKYRQAKGLIDNWLAARDQARKKGNGLLANEIEDGLHNSIRLYKRITPQEAAMRFDDVYARAAKGEFKAQGELSNIASEMSRQMLQSKHGDTVEHFWQQAMGATIQWVKDAIAGLKSLYAKLGAGQPLAKTELAKLIRATERKLDTLVRRATKATPEGPKVGPATAGEGRVFTETPGAPQRSIRQRLAEAIARAKLAHSLGLKSGESALLDYKETEPLSIALRREHSLRQAYGQRGKLAELERAFKSIRPADRARVTKEWTDYIKAEQTRQPLPAVGADTMRLLNARKDTAQGIGGLLKGLNVHVKDSKGRVRPVRLIGDQYYPWRVSNDVRDIFNNRDGSRAAEFNQIVQNEIAAGNVKTRQEFIDKFTHAISGDPHSNDHMSNVERARELRLPYSFYDFSPEAFLHYAGRATDRLAQIGAYGQKLSSKGKDLFDHTIEAVNQSGDLSYDAKRAIVNRVASERKAAFARGEEGVFDRIGATGRKAATLAFLSNWQTSFGNFVSGASQNMVFGGPGNFLKTAAKFPFEWRKNLTEAEDRNILKANFRDVLHDYDLVTNPSWLQKMTQAGLKWGGQNLTENINRVFGMAQAKNILREFVRDYGVKNNPMTRERNEFILRRFGGKPDPAQAQARLNALAAERGTGPLTDEFIRQYVMDVHGTYSQAQAPAHLFDNPVGKTMLQFQKWGFNTGRMANREYVMPLIRALKSGSMADKGYHILRTAAYIGTGAAAGSVQQAVLNAIYRRDPKDPTLAEIGKAFTQGDYGTAIAQSVKRGFGALILSGFTGLLGNYADVITNLMGSDPSGRLKDPMHPPAWGVIEPFIAFVKGWQGEGGALPSETLVRDFATRIASPARVMYNTGMGLANSAGLHFPLAQHYAAQQDRSFARSRIAMFEAQDPVLQQKAAEQGTRAVTIQMAGRRPFDPYRDRILNGLGSGNEIEVNSAIREWLEKVPDNEKAAELKRIKQTISANSPLKVGGSSKPENVMEFLQWAKANLPEGEARRIYALAATYSKTALLTGMEDRSKPMHELAALDYDKTKAPRAISAPAQVSTNARAAVQGRQVMAELVRRQKIAQQLRGAGR